MSVPLPFIVKVTLARPFVVDSTDIVELLSPCSILNVIDLSGFFVVHLADMQSYNNSLKSPSLIKHSLRGTILPKLLVITIDSHYTYLLLTESNDLFGWGFHFCNIFNKLPFRNVVDIVHYNHFNINCVVLNHIESSTILRFNSDGCLLIQSNLIDCDRLISASQDQKFRVYQSISSNCLKCVDSRDRQLFSINQSIINHFSTADYFSFQLSCGNWFSFFFDTLTQFYYNFFAQFSPIQVIRDSSFGLLLTKNGQLCKFKYKFGLNSSNNIHCFHDLPLKQCIFHHKEFTYAITNQNQLLHLKLEKNELFFNQISHLLIRSLWFTENSTVYFDFNGLFWRLDGNFRHSLFASELTRNHSNGAKKKGGLYPNVCKLIFTIYIDQLFSRNGFHGCQISGIMRFLSKLMLSKRFFQIAIKIFSTRFFILENSSVAKRLLSFFQFLQIRFPSTFKLSLCSLKTKEDLNNVRSFINDLDSEGELFEIQWDLIINLDETQSLIPCSQLKLIDPSHLPN
ncbi:hypothetical protein P9112_005452 [Eukaryota sp. TZLM1-RC]